MLMSPDGGQTFLSEDYAESYTLSQIGAINVVTPGGSGITYQINANTGQTVDEYDNRGNQLVFDGDDIRVQRLDANGNYDDAYNSNPEALKSMIHTLAARPAQRRILIAGEMLELGEFAAQLHAQCGRAAAVAGIDVIVGVRGNAAYLVEGATGAAVTGVAGLFLPDAAAAGQWLKENLKPGDVVLLKGSRGVRLERALEGL